MKSIWSIVISQLFCGYVWCASIHVPFKYSRQHIQPINLLNAEDLELIRYLDQGRFSFVFEAKYISGNDYVVVKSYKIAADAKVLKEIAILNELKDVEGVIHIIGVHHNAASNIKSIVFEHMGDDVQWFGHVPNNQLSLHEIKFYFFQFLQALAECHSRHIIHRDIKPRNIIINRLSKKLSLIDFGNGDWYERNKIFSTNVASKHYKSPELLFECTDYDYSVDIWQSGCVLASLLFQEEPFFGGSDVKSQIASISSVVGSGDMFDWANNRSLVLTSAQRKAIGNRTKTPFREFINARNRKIFNDRGGIGGHNGSLDCDTSLLAGLDLIGKMLVVNPLLRLTALECLNHSFFDDVRVDSMI